VDGPASNISGDRYSISGAIQFPEWNLFPSDMVKNMPEIVGRQKDLQLLEYTSFLVMAGEEVLSVPPQ
jgi:hypothetical protein